jgi:hypothetical protein
MADKTYTVALDTSQVDPNAKRAVDAVDQLEDSLVRTVDASGRAGDALGRFASTAGAAAASQSQVFKAATGAIYDFADAYEVLPSLGDAFRQSQRLVAQAAAETTAAMEREAHEATQLQVLMAGQSPAALQASDATRKYASGLNEADGRARGFTNRLQGVAFALDDLQYVGEQGLRPVLNNLAVISPYLFLIGLALDQFIRHFDDLENAVKGTAFEGPLKAIEEGFNTIKQAIGLAKSEASQFAEETRKAAEELKKIQNPEQAQRGKAITEVIERFGGGVQTESLVREAARQQGQNPDRAAVELNQARQGDEGALGNLQALLRRASGRAGLFGQELTGAVERTNPENQAAAQAVTDQQKQAAAEADAANKERQALIAERAKQLAGGDLGTSAFGGVRATPDLIQDALGRAGQDISLDFAEEIRRAFQELIDRQASDKAIALGVSPEEAARSIADERNRPEREQANRREEEFAKSLGADKLSTQAALGGAGAGEVEAYLRQRFGLSAEVAGQIALEGSRDASRQALEGPLRRTSAITSDVQADVQRGIGGQDPQREQVELTRAIKQSLISIDQNTKKDWAGRIVVTRKDF